MQRITQLPPLPGSVSCAAVPNWQRSELNHRLCPICSADNSVVVCIRPDTLRVGQCLGCGMLYLPEVPSEGALLSFYSKYSEFKRCYAEESNNFGRELKLLLWKYLDTRISILKLTGGLKSIRLLDVGAGSGFFCDLAARSGAIVDAIELDERSAACLSSKGIPVHKGIDSGKRYDCVCAFQVLEHVRDPQLLISNISNVLVADGRLLISIPNAGEYAAVGPAWVGFRVDMEHLNYFTLKSVAGLLAQNGLFVEQYWLSAQPGLLRKDMDFARENLFRRCAHIIRPDVADDNPVSNGQFVLTVLARRVF